MPPNYIGQGDAAAHAAAGLIIDLHAAKATGTGPGVNSPATTTIQDLSGNNLHGNLQNFAFTTSSGWVGDGSIDNPYAVKFDGVNDGITIPYSTLYDITNALTLEVWFSANTLHDGFLAGRIWTSEFMFRLVASGVIRTWLNGASFDSMATYSANTMYQAMLVKRSDGTANVYLNTTSIASSTGRTVSTGTDVFTIGYNGNSTFYFNGRIPIVRLYNYDLSSAERTQNFFAGVTWPDDTPIPTYFSYIIAP